jgi:ABC-type transporter Mla subunit MlaD
VNRNHLRLGVTVIVMTLLFFTALMLISGSGLFEAPHRQVVLRFKPVAGMPELTRGAFVMFVGQKVGRVTGTQIVKRPDPDHKDVERQYLEVELEIRRDLELYEDYKISATGPVLGGSGLIEIMSAGDSSKQPVNFSAALDGRTVSFQNSLESVQDTVTQAQIAVKKLAAELDTQRPGSLMNKVSVQLDGKAPEGMVYKINRSIENVEEMTASIRDELNREHDDRFLHKVHEGLDTIQGSLQQLAVMIEENRPRVDATLTNAQAATTTIRDDIVVPLAQEFELPERPPASLLAKIHDAMNGVNSTLDSLGHTSAGIKDTFVINRAQINDLIKNTTDASRQLKLGIEDISAHPWRVLYEPTKAERRELHLFNVAREFAESSAQLDSITVRLNDLLAAYEGDIPVDDVNLVKLRSDLIESIDRFSAAEQALMEAFDIPPATK